MIIRYLGEMNVSKELRMIYWLDNRLEKTSRDKSFAMNLSKIIFTADTAENENHAHFRSSFYL